MGDGLPGYDHWKTTDPRDGEEESQEEDDEDRVYLTDEASAHWARSLMKKWIESMNKEEGESHND